MARYLRALAWVLLAVLLGGCSWLHSGDYLSVTPHEAEYNEDQPEQTIHVRNYAELLSALQNLVDSRTEQGILDVSEYGQSLEEELPKATQYITETYPLGAYAVRALNVVLDQSGASRRANVTIQYGATTQQMQQIQSVRGAQAAEEAAVQALERFSTSLVVQIANYEAPDFAGVVARYAAQHPESVMEMPTVTVRTVPETGDVRIAEVTFTYTNTYTQLSAMRLQVQLVFDSAKNYVSDLTEGPVIADRLCSFLMSRFDYTVGVTATPSYSLLCQGVGDSKAFAQVYAALCSQSGLRCYVVEGTRNGTPWYWNILEFGEGDVCHVDLLGDMSAKELVRRSDGEMEGYVWDAELYPACPEPEAQPNYVSQPVQTTPKETQPPETTPQPPDMTEPPATTEPTEEPTETFLEKNENNA